VFGLYRQHCYFFRREATRDARCAVNHSRCLLCSVFIRKIDTLDLKQHLDLAYYRNAAYRAIFWATMSFGTSVASAAIALLTYLARK
jgi:hypothetical protein